MGCRVYQCAKVAEELHYQNDNVEGLTAHFRELDGKDAVELVEAKVYVDASGSESLLRRPLWGRTRSPHQASQHRDLGLLANAEWAESVEGGTYVQVLSIGHGWLWFIPVGPTRTSIGFVTSADYFKKSGLSTEQIYEEAVSRDSLVRKLTKDATRGNLPQRIGASLLTEFLGTIGS